MKLTLRDQQFSTRQLSRLYVGALSMIALLAIAGQIFIQISLLRQDSDAGVINIAGRQRMLSQELCKTALALVIVSNPATQNADVAELQATLSLWVKSHAGLQQGDPQLGLPGDNSSTVKHLFATIEPNFETMRNTTKQLLLLIDQPIKQPAGNFRANLVPLTDILLTQEPTFLKGMNAIVFQYQTEAEGRVSQLKIAEACLLGLTLLVLLLEALLVFRPATRRLNRTMTALVKAEEKVAAHVAELERKNGETELALNEAMSAHRKVMPHARVVTFGHYQVQGSQGNYWNVSSREVNRTLQLECECLMYRRNLICSHSLAAAALHSALQRQLATGTRRFPLSGEIERQSKG